MSSSIRCRGFATAGDHDPPVWRVDETRGPTTPPSASAVERQRRAFPKRITMASCMEVASSHSDRAACNISAAPALGPLWRMLARRPRWHQRGFCIPPECVADAFPRSNAGRGGVDQDGGAVSQIASSKKAARDRAYAIASSYPAARYAAGPRCGAVSALGKLNMPPRPDHLIDVRRKRPPGAGAKPGQRG